MSSALQIRVGHRLRARRQRLAMTIASLAERSGLSTRYILSAEQGQANLSLAKVEQLCAALDLPMPWLLSEHDRGEIDHLLAERSPDELAETLEWLRSRFGPQQRPLIALLGVRGAGKSTIGNALAKARGMPFVELDARIAALADLSLAEIFSVHGEHFYRKLEYQALSGLISKGKAQVVATGGGLVTDERNFALLKSSATTIWLRAPAEDHWRRVIDQGDRRPMRDHPQAMAQLRTLLEERTPLYGQADFVVDTQGLDVATIVQEIQQFFGG